MAAIAGAAGRRAVQAPGAWPWPVSRDAAPIAATRDYLDWLDATLRDAAERGLAPTEAMLLPIPERFAHWGEARAEWRRSIGFMYGRYERAALPWLSPAR